MHTILKERQKYYLCDCITGSQKYLADNSVDLIITDPPYGIQGGQMHRHYKRRENYVLDGYVEVKGSDYSEFSMSWIKEAERVLRPGGSLYIISGYSNLIHILNALSNTSLRETNHIIWKYNFGVYTRRKYVSSHYHILYYVKPGAPAVFNTYVRFKANERDDRGKSMNYQDREDVWIINRKYKPGKTKNKNELPLPLVEKLILYSSRENDLVADFFLGGFSTAVSAIGLNRRVVGFEINAKAFRFGIKQVQDLPDGFLMHDFKETTEVFYKNQGKKWHQEEDLLLKKRYIELTSQLRTKKQIIQQLQIEFQRGYFAIINRLEIILKKSKIS
jgi:site-specific DNA-methyltransferase (adenine-specific)